MGRMTARTTSSRGVHTFGRTHRTRSRQPRTRGSSHDAEPTTPKEPAPTWWLSAYQKHDHDDDEDEQDGTTTYVHGREYPSPGAAIRSGGARSGQPSEDLVGGVEVELVAVRGRRTRPTGRNFRTRPPTRTLGSKRGLGVVDVVARTRGAPIAGYGDHRSGDGDEVQQLLDGPVVLHMTESSLPTHQLARAQRAGKPPSASRARRRPDRRQYIIALPRIALLSASHSMICAR
jgi:hypothetical protein